MRAFPSSKISYHWQGGALGGFRKGGYAEHMTTAKFTEAVTSLTRRAERVCIMCAESNPAECAVHPQEDLWRDV